MVSLLPCFTLTRTFKNRRVPLVSTSLVSFCARTVYTAVKQTTSAKAWFPILFNCHQLFSKAQIFYLKLKIVIQIWNILQIVSEFRRILSGNDCWKCWSISYLIIPDSLLLIFRYIFPSLPQIHTSTRPSKVYARVEMQEWTDLIVFLLRNEILNLPHMPW